MRFAPLHPSQWAGVLLCAVALAALAGARSRWEAAADPPGLLTVVEIRGARKPGAYVFQGSEVEAAGAFEAAGGCARCPSVLPGPFASLRLRAGDALEVVCREGEAVDVRLAPMRGGARLALGKPMDLNEAGREELLLVPRMRPSFALAIVERREARPWRSLHDLQAIDGVGPRTAELWKKYLEVR